MFNDNPSIKGWVIHLLNTTIKSLSEFNKKLNNILNKLSNNYIHIYYTMNFQHNVHLIIIAQRMASIAHHGQVRKLSNLPYIVHPSRVASNVMHYYNFDKDSTQLTNLVIAAYLHDSLEDTNLTESEIEITFGNEVLSLVKEVTTDKEKKKLFESKGHYLADKMLHMTDRALFLKLMDRLDNITDLSSSDSNNEFPIRYRNETRLIMNFLLENDSGATQFKQIIDDILLNCEKIN